MSKVVLITGCSSGFGFLTAKTLASAGYKVYATMRGVEGKNAESAGKLRDWAQQEGKELTVLELDVTDEATIQSAVNTILEKENQLDVVVNNAGVVSMGILEGFTIDQAKELFDVNVFGVMRVNRAVLPQLRKQNSGLIINISSGVGRIVLPFMGVYAASKFALEALSETQRFELEPLGIDVVIIEPGAYPTEIFQKIGTPADTETVKNYGVVNDILAGFNKSMEAMFENPQDPQDIPDAIKELIETEQGKRPLRLPVDKQGMGEAVKAINATSDQIAEQMLKNFGLSKQPVTPQ